MVNASLSGAHDKRDAAVVGKQSFNPNPALKLIALIGLHKAVLYLRQALFIADIIRQHRPVAQPPLIEQVKDFRIVVIPVGVTAKDKHFLFPVKRRQFALVIVKNTVAVF